MYTVCLKRLFNDHSAPGTDFTTSVSVCAKVNWVSNVRRTVFAAAELAGVGDPFVDDDQAQRVVLGERAQRISGVVAVRVGVGYQI